MHTYMNTHAQEHTRAQIHKHTFPCIVHVDYGHHVCLRLQCTYTYICMYVAHGHNVHCHVCSRFQYIYIHTFMRLYSCIYTYKHI